MKRYSNREIKVMAASLALGGIQFKKSADPYLGWPKTDEPFGVGYHWREGSKGEWQGPFDRFAQSVVNAHTFMFNREKWRPRRNPLTTGINWARGFNVDAMLKCKSMMMENMYQAAARGLMSQQMAAERQALIYGAVSNRIVVDDIETFAPEWSRELYRGGK